MGLFSFKNKKTVIACPVDGEVLPITQSTDKVFSEKMMGDGFLVKPENGDFYAPVNGKVSMVFETKHAIAFKTNDGLSVLIHIGMDTVKLQGKGYEILVNTGDKVKVGQKIAKVDLKFINENGFSTDTPIVLTNIDNKEIELVKTGKCKALDGIIHL